MKQIIRDNLFGGQDKLANAVRIYRTRHLGLNHLGAKHPAIPKPGEPVTLWATTSFTLPFKTVRLAYSVDDWKTQQELDFYPAKKHWDSLIWNWVQHWELTLPAQPEGSLLRYLVWADLSPDKTGIVKKVFADSQTTVRRNSDQFAIFYSPHNLPEWSKNARVYQIFVDRFNPGKRRSWLQTEDLTQPMGGTLRGVIEKLDHIQSLGFNAIWLTPIFASPTHHGYDATDYFKIEPRLGSLADFDELIEQAHQRKLRVILDFVANHVSNKHPAMLEALKDRKAPTKKWFEWYTWPRYRSFYHVKSMPELNLCFGSPARAHLLEAAQYWLKRGVDGYRLDYAHGTGLDFWVDFRQACEEVNPECWTFGEVVTSAEEQAAFAGGMHGTLDFLSCQALRASLAQQVWPLSKLAGYLEAYHAAFPEGFSRPSFIDNHDMNRFLYVAYNDPRLLEIALTLLYLMPGPPIVFAGTESLLSQHRSIHDEDSIGFDESRLPMNWEDLSGKKTVEFPSLSYLANMRANLIGLDCAVWQTLFVDDWQRTALWLIKREGQNNLYFALNLSEQERKLNLGDHSGSQKLVCLGEGKGKLSKNELSLLPCTCQVWLEEGM